ncbi:ROK family protein [Roseiarcaceae bacterium H3SJ34-1]|uniref:ROK family protein n=1 Tax=Terripilifer ovatus TaxID=3032367 RepID=UPI003AB91ADE|nr:ROK family protein [Roseiarcaceae bacterium H3SJ34-1]
MSSIERADWWGTPQAEIGTSLKTLPRTLAIDVGGTALKASVLDGAGQMLHKRVRIPTPYPCPPETLLRAIADLTAPLAPFDRISIGFPGVIRNGCVITAPHFGTKIWRYFALEDAVAHRLGKSARLLNDAEVQGLGIVAGHGLEVVLTLGTGVGSAVFSNGILAPHLELAHHPVHKGKTYNGYIGDKARRSIGKKAWNRRVLKVVETVRSLLHYDVLYLGGGNSEKVVVDLPVNVRLASNDAGITGGIRLWDDAIWRAVGDEPSLESV